MRSKIDTSTLNFLKELKVNNNRDWFNTNKDRYTKAKENFEEFMEELLLAIGEFDPSIKHHRAKDCIFRIYRDVRFGKDKSPYKTHFGAHITSAAKKSEIHSRAGYYLHLDPEEAFLAGGAYLPQGDWLKKIRSEIAHNPNSFKAIINSKDFVNTFGEMEGDKLKTAPRDYPKDHPEIELLRHKSFLASHKLDEKMLSSDKLLDHCTEVFSKLKPFDDFLNNCITTN